MAGMTYFTDDKDYVNYFANRGWGKPEGARVIPCYIRINKPFDAREASEMKMTIDEYAQTVGITRKEMLEEHPTLHSEAYFWRYLLMTPHATKAGLEKQGYDGIIQLEQIDRNMTPDTTSYVVFNNRQIRSALAQPKPKKLLDLDKVGAVRLYHGTKAKLQVGMILTPQPHGYVNDPEVAQHEAIMENARPEGALPRNQSVYMVADPDEIDFAGGYEDYIYEVEPIGEVERNNMGWYSEVSMYEWDDEADPRAVEAAESYWLGSDFPKASIWEYRAPQAKIVRLVSTLHDEKTSAIKTKPMDAEWRKRLDETLADEFQQRPDLLVLRNLLLEFGGGEAMVRRMDNSPAEVERLMERGKFWKGRGSTFRKMRSNQCHGNSVCLMKEGVGSVANGYALSPDGLWRQHSWIVTPDGGIVETTVRRAAYYGVILTPQEVKAEYSVMAAKTADHDLEVGDGEKYWAGEGNAASGILPVCPQTGNVCLAWRSKYVNRGNCWGTIGGAVQQGISPAQSAREELKEETGQGVSKLIPAYVFTDRGFTYHNFIGVTGSEFSFSPQPYPEERAAEIEELIAEDPRYTHQRNPGWETDYIQWVPYAEVLADMKAHSNHYHPGMLKLFQNLRH